MSISLLRAGVAGAGAFGAHHAGKYVADPRTRLAAIFDLDSARAEALAEKHGARAFRDFDAFLAAVDVVTIATPASTHAELSLRSLAAGKPTLSEKPIATNMEDAARVIAAARDAKVVLACGHQERIVFEAMGLFAADEAPLEIESVREGPWSGRGGDVSATLDLAVHDADLALQLLRAPVAKIEARGRKQESQHWDEIHAEVAFTTGARLKLTASRIAPERRRTMRIRYKSGELKVDFIARSFENGTGHKLNERFAETDSGKDPLGANVFRFLDAATGAAVLPAVTGEEAAEALKLALAIDAAAS